MAEKTQRNTWLDIARGICIACMIYCHATTFMGGSNRIVTLSGTWFLVFFFFCSGLFFSDKYGFKQYTARQGKKLLIPYAVIVGAYLFLNLLFHLLDGKSLLSGLWLFFTSFFTALPADFEKVALFNARSYGIGPIWFFPCLFLSCLIYKLLYKVKGKLIISIALAVLASISQKYIVLPFTIQNAFIGCMFIALGAASKDLVFRYAEKLKSLRLLVLAAICVVTLFIHAQALTLFTSQPLDLGSNNYSCLTLIHSFSGFLFLIPLAIFVERTAILDEFLSFYGRESLIIVVLHTIDIMLLRNWTNQEVHFGIGTILLYPFLFYLYRRYKEHRASKV